ncbi:MAG: hypothetical protein WC549_00395 [Actinomycetota bacterium]
MILDKKIMGVCSIASTDETRPILTGVLLKDNKAIATDGYSLIETELPHIDNVETKLPPTGNQYINGETMLISAVQLSKVLTNIPNKPKLPILGYAWTAKSSNEKTVKIVSSDLETTNAPEIMTIEGNYPDYNKVKPVTEVKAKITVNAKYLIKLLQAVIKTDPDQINNIVTIEVRSEKEPIVIKNGNGENSKTYAMQMPCRV